MNTNNQESDASDGKKEATKTYLEQTKLLVTLASAFLVAPAGLAVFFLKDRIAIGVTRFQFWCFVISEGAFVASVLTGYVVFGTVAGSQDAGTFDVFRPATKWSSLLQLAFYVLGMALFVLFAFSLIQSPVPVWQNNRPG